MTISRLESLLSRIRTRAAEPRQAAQAGVSASPAAFAPVAVAPAVFAPAAPPAAAPARAWSPPVAAPPAPVPAPPPAPPVVVAPPVARAPISEAPPVELVEEPTTLPPPAPVSSDLDFAVDVDVTSATPEPASVAPAVQSVPPVATVSDAPGVGPAIEQHVEMLADDEEFAGTEDEKIEEAPASSRRPVTSPPERLAELAFGAEEPESPRHTPPKSGRLPAPPAVEFDADVTGVRAAATVSISHEDDATQPSAQGAAPSVLVAQVSRPDFAASAKAPVADVIGQAQRFAPATFLALLDASLSL